MQKMLFVAVCLISFAGKGFGQQRNINNNYNFLYSVGANVNVRAMPNAASPIVAKLALGERVERNGDNEAESDTLLVINGLRGRWEPVKTAEQKTGYVFSPFLALGMIKNGSNPDIMFLVGQTNSDDSMKIVVIQADRLLQTLVFEARLEGEGGNRFGGISSFGKAGIPNIDELMSVSLSANCCGCTSNDVMFVWDGKKLHHFFTSSDSSEGGGSETWIDRTFVVLPIDADGQKGVVHYYMESGTNSVTDDTETGENTLDVVLPIVYAEKVHKVMVWNGEKLVEQL